jgi:predicted short-subunit dehydrogenase-like oxidoreductase (DUF2520 family)
VKPNRLTFNVIGESPLAETMRLALAAAQHVPQNDNDADLLFFCLNKDELPLRIETYLQTGQIKPGQLVAHSSAEYGYSVLGEAAKLGAIPLAIHPAMRFTGTSIDLARLHDSRIAVAAPTVALPIAQSLAIELGGEPVVISEEARPAYAEAISVALDFSALVTSQAIGLLEEAGVENARAIIGPVIRSSIDRALADGHQPLDPEDAIGGFE